jgi:hypothetical protein
MAASLLAAQLFYQFLSLHQAKFIMLKTSQETAPLQKHYWPPVNPFQGFSQGFAEFLELTPNQQHQYLETLKEVPEQHGQFLHHSLAQIYAYCLGYQDSPCYLKTDESLERKLLNAKLTLETELHENGLSPEPIPRELSQNEAADYLKTLAVNNPGIEHKLFDYLETAPRNVLLRFLQHEVMRNEVVDDEVSLLLPGLQGAFKTGVASNLWDECGRGKLVHAHTYWLRQFLEATNGWKELTDYRKVSPWFSKITSNTFFMLLTRPGLNLSAYGYFLMSESAVAPHFKKILAGLGKTELTQEDITIYFDAHLKIDKHHGQELVDAIRYQEPCLTQPEINLLLQGAHLYIATATTQYNYMLSYLSSLE